jgi:uncharacterized SAM-binding protein YcdF (DUF218 family)
MRWPRIARGLLLLLVLWLWFLAIQIYHYSRESYSQPADVAIVLGAAVWNERPSPVFEERIKHAIDLYKSESVQAIIFTGGIGKGDRSAESQVAREYAILHGVPAEHVYYETRSRTTRENLQEAKRILDQRNLPNVVIVSDPLHMKRAVAIARDLGIAAQPSPTPTSRYRTWQSRLGFLLRETYYYASYLMRRPFISDVAPDLHTLSVQTIAMCRPLE